MSRPGMLNENREKTPPLGVSPLPINMKDRLLGFGASPGGSASRARISSVPMHALCE
ncbi:Uncharacterised protein [Mycobacterium tuberculosis]|nr:Uncharacterised protein [Mycobacterium tuberculosis]